MGSIDWFYRWLDPKILRIEAWANKKVVQPELIDIDLDKVSKGEVRKNEMYRHPAKNGDHGPFITNLTGGKVVESLQGISEFEAFAFLTLDGTGWWRHRDGGETADFKEEAFKDMKEFFNYVHGDNDKYWSCVLKTKALRNDDGQSNKERNRCEEPSTST